MHHTFVNVSFFMNQCDMCFLYSALLLYVELVFDLQITDLRFERLDLVS